MQIVWKRNKAYPLTIPLVDKENPDVYIAGQTITREGFFNDAGSGAWSTFTPASLVEIGSTGIYYCDLTASNLNHDHVLIKLSHSSGLDTSFRFDMEVEEDIADQVLDADLGDHAADDTPGFVLNKLVMTSVDLETDVNASSIIGRMLNTTSGVWSYSQTTDSLDSIAAKIPTAAQNADAVWDEEAGDHQTTGRFGQVLGDNSSGNSLWTNVDTLVTRIPDILSLANINTEADSALSDIHLDHLLATDYDPSSKPGLGTALLNELVENDLGVSRFTTNALENGPSGTFPTAATIADAVWDEDASDHTDAGTFGLALGNPTNSNSIWSLVNANVDATISSRSTVTSEQVKDEADDALSELNLDHLFKVSIGSGDVTNGSFAANITSSSATPNYSTFNNQDDSLQAIRDRGESAWTTVTGTVIANAVWDEDIVATHNATDTAGLILSALTHRSVNLATHADAGSVVGQLTSTGPTFTFLRATDSLESIRDALITTAEVNTEVDTALTDIHLDHLLASDYDPSSKPGTATALLNELVENDGGVSRFTANALEEAPSGSFPTAAAIADAVWDEDIVASHETADTAGLIVSSLTHRAVADMSTHMQIDSVLAQAMDAGTAWSYVRTTDSLEAVRNQGDSAWITLVAGDVWDVVLATHTTSDTAGLVLNMLTQDSVTLSDDVHADSIIGQILNDTASTWAYNQTTDSLEALRDRGDAAWTTATGFSTHSQSDIWSVATRTLSAAAITSSTFAASAIDASSLATDAVNEIVDAVWDENIVSAHGASDTSGLILSELTRRSVTLSNLHLNSVFGQLLDDGTAWSYSRATDSLEAIRDNHPNNFSALSIQAGSGEVSVNSFTASAQAEIESEVNDALVVLNLDHLLAASVIGTDVVDDSVIAYMVSKDATTRDWDDFNNQTDSLQAIRDHHPTNFEIMSIVAATGEVAVNSFTTSAKAEIKSEVNDALVDLHLDHWVAASGTITADTGDTILSTDLTDADNFWDLATIRFTSGTLAGQSRCIRTFTDSGNLLQVQSAMTGDPQINDTFIIISGDQTVNIRQVEETDVAAASGRFSVNTTHISGDSGAADNLEKMLDGTGGVSLAADIAGNVTGTIGGFTAPAAADIELQCDQALASINLDHLFKNSMVAGDVTNSSFAARITSKEATPTFTSFLNTTDSLEAIADAVPGGGPSVDAIADGVWDELRSGHTDVGSFGEGVLAEDLNTAAKASVNTEADSALSDIQLDHLIQVADPGSIVTTDSLWAKMSAIDGTYADFNDNTDSLEALADAVPGGGPSVDAIADAVWDEQADGHQNQGTYGQVIGDSESTDRNIWDESLKDDTVIG